MYVHTTIEFCSITDDPLSKSFEIYAQGQEP
jgi:hypothetical protein